jgi:hypothetical protein
MTSLEINFQPTVKQDLIFEYFDDDITTEILYGGSAGSAKSYGICALIILKALEYPGARIGLARNELTNLKKTTIISFFEVAADWGLIPDEHFTYNSTAGIIKFYNDSEIILLELSFKPSDPQYTRLGGHLLTFGCIDEVGEVDERGFQIFKTRLGRWKNEEFNIKPIVIMTCNPSKNFIYRNYYLPSVDGTILPYQKFVQALPTDNPYIPQSYLDNLKKLPFADRERLLHGNWEYDDDPTSLMSYDEIINIWDGAKKIDGKKYITADIAFTSDKMVIMVWDELTIVDIIVNPPGKIEDIILALAKEHNVPQYQIAFDSDGVGKFLEQRLRNSKAIVNNARALKDENYKNLKTQLYFKLAELIRDNRVKCMLDSHKQEMIEELQVVRHQPTNVVGKLSMVDKGEVKKLIGRSPDFSDAMAYRMYFEFKKVGTRTFKIG